MVIVVIIRTKPRKEFLRQAALREVHMERCVCLY